ncbi:Protein 21.1, partial [Giardia lamblia P15]
MSQDVHLKKAISSQSWFGAITAGDIAEVSRLCARFLRETDRTGTTGLMYAAASDNEEVVQMLVKDENSMRNHIGETALLIAAAQNSAKVIPLLLPYEHEMVLLNGATALHVAVQHGSMESIPKLIDYYSCARDRNGFTAMEYCAYNNLLPQLSLLVKHGSYTIEDLKNAASIADSMGHKLCAAALWKASNTYPGTSLSLSNLKVTTAHIDVPPNSAQSIDSLPGSKFAATSQSYPLTLTQLDANQLQFAFHALNDETPMDQSPEKEDNDPAVSCSDVVLTSNNDPCGDRRICMPNSIAECSGSTSPSIFQGRQESVLALDVPQKGNELVLSPNSLDSSLPLLASQLSGTDRSAQRSEVRILVEHLRTALEQARNDLKDKTVTILRLEEEVRKLTEKNMQRLPDPLSATEVLSLREEVAYYKHLLVKRDAHEKELKQEISRLQNESTDVLSSLRCRIKQDQDHSKDLRSEEKEQPLSQVDLLESLPERPHDLCALAYAVKQLWTMLDVQETNPPVPDLVPEKATVTDILLNFKFLGVQLQKLTCDASSRLHTDSPLSTKTILDANLNVSNEQIEQLIEELADSNAKRRQLEEQFAEAQASIDQYKQLTEVARSCQAQSEARLSQYFEVHRNELALITDEVNSAKEAIVRMIKGLVDKDVILTTTTDLSSSGSSKSLTYYVELVFTLINRYKEIIENIKQELEQLQADNDALRLTNTELKRLNDVLEHPIRLSSSNSDTSAMEARIITLGTKNTDLHNELVDCRKQLYDLQKEIACYRDKLLTAHSSEELEAVKLRSQLSMYADAYKTLKDSSLSMGQELDMLRSELDLYRSLHGDVKERTQSQPVDTDAITQRAYLSTLESSNLTTPSGPLSTTVIRQNVMTPLMIAAQQGSLRECKNNMQYVRQQLPNGMTALMFAASAGNKEVVEFLASHECAFIRHDNMCAAEIALTCGHYDCAELLRSTEALRTSKLDGMTEGMLSNIISAATSNSLFAVWSFLPDQKGMRDDQGMTALMHAAMLGHRDIVRLLSGSELRLQDNR